MQDDPRRSTSLLAVVLPAMLVGLVGTLLLIALLPHDRWWWTVTRLSLVAIVMALGAFACRWIEHRTFTGRIRR
jgi:hypothetical protein